MNVSQLPVNPVVFLVLFLLILAVVMGYLYTRARTGDAVSAGRGSSAASPAKLIGTDGYIVNLHNNFVIGRSSASNLKLSNSSVSRRHARLYYLEGVWYIQDLGSAGGTIVNGQQVRMTRLEPGDTITLGTSNFIFQA